MSSQVNITSENNEVVISTEQNKVVIVDQSAPTNVEVIQPITTVVEVVTTGPQGAIGPQGDSVFTNLGSGSYSATASFYISGSLTINGQPVEPIFIRNRVTPTQTSIIYEYQSIFNPSNLLIPTTSIFIIEENADYYVLGNLINSGAILVDGTLQIGGALINIGSITGTGTIL